MRQKEGSAEPAGRFRSRVARPGTRIRSPEKGPHPPASPRRPRRAAHRRTRHAAPQRSGTWRRARRLEKRAICSRPGLANRIALREPRPGTLSRWWPRDRRGAYAKTRDGTDDPPFSARVLSGASVGVATLIGGRAARRGRCATEAQGTGRARRNARARRRGRWR